MTVATVTGSAYVERLAAGEHEYDRGWEMVGSMVGLERRQDPNTLLSAWFHEQQPGTGTYRLVTSWGARSDEIPYRSEAA